MAPEEEREGFGKKAAHIPIALGLERVTHQIKELQEVVNTVQDAQVFYKDLETASSSVSIHGPGQQSMFPCFSSKPRRKGRDISVTRNLNSSLGHVLKGVTNSQASATAALQAAASSASMSAVASGQPSSAQGDTLREEGPRFLLT